MDETDLDNWFSYHPPTPDQFPKYQHVRAAAKVFARTVYDCCPDSADRTAAIRKIREAVMTANSSIACGGK